MNKNACEIANKKKRDCIGKKCYEVLWNRLTPCEHCQKDFEPAAEFLESEIAVNGQKYFVRAKSISWGGIDARVQYIQKEFNCPLEHKTKILKDLGIFHNSIVIFDRGYYSQDLFCHCAS